MKKMETFEEQFYFDRNVYLKNIDFTNWHRYFYTIKSAIDFEPKNILEIGSGDGIVKNCLSPIVGKYEVMDINQKLNPDHLWDIREKNQNLIEKFDFIIATDILEHIPFSDIEKSFKNISLYLRQKGRAIITIPHRGDYFLFMFPYERQAHTLLIPYLLISPATIIRYFIRKNWIDFCHYWEIGVNKIKRNDIEEIIESSGLKILNHKNLLHVDFWTLEK